VAIGDNRYGEPMSNIIKSTRRQIEILSLVAENHGKLSPVDLEDRFKIGKATLERDLQQLRAWGVDIHSVKGRLRLSGSISEDKLVELLSLYIAYSSSESVFQKSLRLLCKQLGEKALSTFVLINRGINESRVLKVTHFNLQRNTREQRTIHPYGITLLGKRWLLLGYVEEHRGLRHYLIENISALAVLDRTFKPDKDFDIAKYYENVWGRWHHEKTYNVKIWFDPSVAHVILNRLWHTNQKVRKQNDGSVIFEAKVTGLQEITNWVLPWGKLARVREPRELKEKVCKLAQETLSSYVF